uniref:Ycf34 n=1 Tax=Liagoropsis maxima TaxID=1653392 RepID=A0A1G4NVR0_9FLOR|nr:Hypothetical protein ycf34 [Liagoropsis maxima]SCW22750.1 Hypothetical protein ycf34 [Liagoropsis maxima]
MCICINCFYVHSCSTYRYIKKQHGEKLNIHHNEKTFKATNPIIHVNVNMDSPHQTIYMDWDVVECLSFLDKPGYWIQ